MVSSTRFITGSVTRCVFVRWRYSWCHSWVAPSIVSVPPHCNRLARFLSYERKSDSYRKIEANANCNCSLECNEYNWVIEEERQYCTCLSGPSYNKVSAWDGSSKKICENLTYTWWTRRMYDTDSFPFLIWWLYVISFLFYSFLFIFLLFPFLLFLFVSGYRFVSCLPSPMKFVGNSSASSSVRVRTCCCAFLPCVTTWPQLNGYKLSRRRVLWCPPSSQKSIIS